MVWLLVGAAIWVALAVPAAVLIGTAIRLAEQRRTTEAGPVESLLAENPATRGSVPCPRPPVPGPMGRAERTTSALDSGLA